MTDGAGQGASVGVVIVTYDSGPIVEAVVDAVLGGSLAPASVVLVDNASTDRAAVDRAGAGDPRVQVLRQEANLGFCAANNIGIRALGDIPFVLLLNPDAVVTESFLAAAVGVLVAEPAIGALGPKLLKLDEATMQPTGRIDSAGIFLTRYGRIFDRGQGEIDTGQYDADGPVDVPALCAAAMLCRRAALETVSDAGAVFDEAFFMYKEDVDLSLRLRAAGWRVVLDTGTVVHHRRGNDQIDRSSTPPWVRRRSVANEWRIWRKGIVPSRVRVPMLGYLALKSVAVRLGF